MVDYRRFSFTADSVKPMLFLRLKDGKRVEPKKPDAEQLRLSRENMMKQMEAFDPSYKRILNPHIYKVSVTEKLKDLKIEFIKANLK